MNVVSVARIIGGVTLVVGSFVIGKTFVKSGKKLAITKVKNDSLEAALDEQEKELNELKKTRDGLL